MPKPNRSFLYRIGKKSRRRIDAMIARSSRVPNTPVLDPALFPWMAGLRAAWPAIAEEAMVAIGAAPALHDISPDHQRIAPPAQWRAFFLHGYGERFEPNIARCPRTAAAVARVPGLNSAFFSILAPGTHIPEHRGVTKGLITCHLGLRVPQQGSCRMNVGGETVGWAEGRTLVFDDTYRHEVWNDTGATRIVLLIQFRRPLRLPGSLVADLFLRGIRRSPFVRETRANIDQWEAGMRALEAAHQ